MTQANYRPNPFHVLGLPKDTPNDVIAARAEELLATARSDAERDLYAWARSELIADPETRARYEDLEPSDTEYERERRWEDFMRRHRRLPSTPPRTPAGADAQAPLLSPDAFHLDVVAGLLIRWLADAEVEDAAPLFQTMPTAADGVPGLELRDVLFG